MLIEKFLQYLKYEKAYSDHTCISYKTDLTQFKEYVERSGSKEFDPTCIDSEIVRKWMMSLKLNGEKATSINRKISALKSLYRYLKKNHLVEIDPTKQVILPKREKRLPVFLKESEMTELLDGGEDYFSKDFEGLRNKLMIESFYCLGIRLSELIGLKDKNVDLSGSTVTVLGKGNKQRKIPFGEHLRQSIIEYMEERKKSVSSQSDSFFVKQDGMPLYPMMVYRIIHEHIERVSTLTKKSPHVLRHTFATAMLNNGAELNVVKELLGHANLAATEVYTHTTFEQLQKIYKQAHPRA